MSSRLMQDLGMILLGLGMLLCSSFLDATTALLIFILSSAFLVIALCDFGLFLRWFSKNVNSFQKDTSGLAWIWIAGFGLTIPFCAIVYWALDYPFDLISEVSLGVYTFTGTMAYAWDTSRLIISYLLAFVIVYAVLWVIQNSKAHTWGA